MKHSASRPKTPSTNITSGVNDYVIVACDLQLILTFKSL